MVNNEICLPIYGSMESSDFQSVDAFINNLIAKHCNNSEMTNLMALEATALVTSVESRSRNLESQNWLVRLWNEARGKNQKVVARNNRDLAESQYLAQQMLNKLAENNLMTYQMVVALGDKVSRIVDDVNNTRLEMAEINQALVKFFASLRQNLELKFVSFERNDDLLFWKENMMVETVYKGKNYSELTRPEKIVCLASEFYRHSHQQWSPRDLTFLKSIICQLGHDPDEKVTLKEVYQNHLQDKDLLKQLFKDIDDNPPLSETSKSTPTLLSFNKLNSLYSDEAYIVDTILQYTPETPRDVVSIELVSNFILKHTGRDLGNELPMFDAVMNFVGDLTIQNQLNIIKKTNALNNNVISDYIQEVKPDDVNAWLDNPEHQLPLVGKSVKCIEVNRFFHSKKPLILIPEDNKYILLDILVDRDGSKEVIFSHSKGLFKRNIHHSKCFNNPLQMHNKVLPRILNPLELFGLQVESKEDLYKFRDDGLLLDTLKIFIVDIDDSLKCGHLGEFETQGLKSQGSIIITDIPHLCITS